MSDETPVPAVPQDLQDRISTIKAFAQTHNLLREAQFPSTHFEAVSATLDFLKRVHESAIEAASKHEAAALIPELKEYLEKKSQEEAVNGPA